MSEDSLPLVMEYSMRCFPGESVTALLPRRVSETRIWARDALEVLGIEREVV